MNSSPAASHHGVAAALVPIEIVLPWSFQLSPVAINSRGFLEIKLLLRVCGQQWPYFSGVWLARGAREPAPASCGQPSVINSGQSKRGRQPSIPVAYGEPTRCESFANGENLFHRRRTASKNKDKNNVLLVIPIAGLFVQLAGKKRAGHKPCIIYFRLQLDGSPKQSDPIQSNKLIGLLLLYCHLALIQSSSWRRSLFRLRSVNCEPSMVAVLWSTFGPALPSNWPRLVRSLDRLSGFIFELAEENEK